MSKKNDTNTKSNTTNTSTSTKKGQGNGGGWPSTTGNPSGKGRSNNTPKSK